MKNKALSVLITFVLIFGVYLCTAPDACAVEATGSCGTNLVYVLTDNGNLYILGTGAMDNYTASSPSPWHDYAALINYVSLSTDVSSIGDYAFSGCTYLYELTGTDGITSIGSHAFDGCSYLENMPKNASSIGSYAFRGCSSLSAGYVSGSSLGEGVFYGCSSLSSVSLSGGMSRIPSYTFFECYNLSSVSIPSSVRSIGESAFDGAGIYSVDLPSGVTELGAKAFRNTHLTSFTLPEGMTEVPDRLLSRCSNLESLTIHEGVTKIYDNAFFGCSSLMGVNLPESLTEMGEGVFSGCSSLATLNLKKNLKTIPVSAFSDCTGLTSLDIPTTVETVSDEAFKGCTALTTVMINEGVATLGNSVFAGCEALDSVTLPTSIKTIGDGVFADCPALTEVKYAGYLSRWTKVEIGENNELLSLDHIVIEYIDGGNLDGGSVWRVSRDGVLFISGTGSIENFEQGSAPWRGHSTEITSVVIDGRITNLGSYCFEGLNRLTEISLPRNVTRISQGMFKDCTALVNVSGMSNVKNIGEGAFENCVSLAIDIPTVITLGNRAFAGCESLDNIILNCETVGDGAFENCTGLKKVIIRSNVHNIGVNAFNGCEPSIANFVGSQEELRALNIGAGNEALTKVLNIYYYIKNVYLGYGFNKKDAMASISDKTYHILEVDLNDDGDGYVCVGYSLTNDIDEALTDIKVFSTQKSPAASMEINGVTYFLISQPISTDSSGNTAYLCTTKDQSAGDAIAMIGVSYGDKSTFTDSESWEQVKNISGSEINISGTERDIRMYFTSDMTADITQPIGGTALYVALAAVAVSLAAGLLILLYVAKKSGKRIKLSKDGIFADADEAPAETDSESIRGENVHDENVFEQIDGDEPVTAEHESAEEAENVPPDDLFDITIPDFDYEDDIDEEVKTPAEVLSGAGAKLKKALKREKTTGVPTELDEEPKTFRERLSDLGNAVKAFFIRIKDFIADAFRGLKNADASGKTKESAKKDKTVEKTAGKSAKKSNSMWDKRQEYDAKNAQRAKAKKERKRKKAEQAKKAESASKQKKDRKDKVDSGKQE